MKFIIKNRFINYLGIISYGIYMFHSITLYISAYLFANILFLRELNSNLVVIFSNLFTFILTLIFSHLSYKYFESYFLKLKHKFRE